MSLLFVCVQKRLVNLYFYTESLGGRGGHATVVLLLLTLVLFFSLSLSDYIEIIGGRLGQERCIDLGEEGVLCDGRALSTYSATVEEKTKAIVSWRGAIKTIFLVVNVLYWLPRNRFPRPA